MYDGTFTSDGFTRVDLAEEVYSFEYDDMAVALSNCPANEDICGEKFTTLTNLESDPVTLSTRTLETSQDSCHWLVRSLCDVPEITIAEDNLL